MKHFKKVFAILLSAGAALALPLCGCGLFGINSNTSELSDYSSDTAISETSLMTVRETIRSFNISIDTAYYQNTMWHTRSAGEGLGSGVVFKSDDSYYYALTNNHVITDKIDGVKYTVKYTITDIYGTSYTSSNVKLIMSDETNDIAIIRFAKGVSATYTLPSVNYTARKDTNVVKDELVFAVGNPSGVNNVVTYGQIIGLANIENVTYQVINHNALINPGNSGGALCDIDGNLLGLNTWGTEDEDDNNYSIPLSIINDYIAQFEESLTTT